MYAWAMLLCTLGCSPSESAQNIEVAIVIDKTNQMPAFPDAKEIVSQLGLTANPWPGIKITATYASDRDINDVMEVTLDAENQWSGNLDLRKAQIKLLTRQLQQCLDSMRYAGACPHSIVYRAIARQANRLADSNTAQRYLLVYSDLVENDINLNFYNPQTLARLKASPGSIEKQLTAELLLKSLKGLQVWFIYSPASFAQNNSYMLIADYYSRLFSVHGAIPHVASKFMSL